MYHVKLFRFQVAKVTIEDDDDARTPDLCSDVE